MIELNLKLNSKQTLIVGVSGGADSVALLHLLNKKSKEIGFKIVCVHVNHHIRGLDSNHDEKHVEKFCEDLGVEFVKYDVDCLAEQKKTGESLEQVARRLRYDCFWDAFDKFKANYLALAHHKNDQAETILMNIIRGSGPLGAIGIKQREKVLRPLLEFSKAEIIEYCKENKLSFVKDKTNDDILFTRNYIRNVIFPQLEKINPNVQDTLVNFGKILEMDENYFTANLPYNFVKFDEKSEKIYITCEIFKFHPSISVRLIKYALAKFNWAVDLTRAHYDMVLKLDSIKTGSKVSLPHNIIAIKDYEHIVFEKNEGQKVEQINKFNIGKIEFSKIKIETEFVLPEDVDYSSDLKYVDYLKIPQNAVFRTRKAGDRFTKINGGTTTLSDYLIDKKVPQRDRDNIIVLAYGNEILWAQGLDISDKVKIDPETEKIVSIKVTKK